MASDEPRPLPDALYRRGRLITPLARWLSVGLAVLTLAILWHHPRTNPWASLAVIVVYVAFNLASHFWLQPRYAGSRALKVAHDLADVLAVAVGAALSG